MLLFGASQPAPIRVSACIARGKHRRHMGEKINADVYAAHGLHSAEEITRHSHPPPHQRGATQNLKTDQRQQYRLDNVVAIDAAHGIHNFDVYWSAPEAG